MRKPLVVAGMATAVLLAGAVAATTAEARPAPGAAAPAGPDGGIDGGRGHRGYGGAGPAASPGGQSVVDDRPPPAMLPPVAHPPSIRPPLIRPPVTHPPLIRPPVRRPVLARPPLARPPLLRPPVVQRPANRPGTVAVEPVRAQPPMVLLAGRMSAARAVTSADVSSSPASSVQMNVLILVNERRRRAGCGPLSLDRRLIDAANEHAADMARHGYFAHASRNGDDAGDRVRDAGFRWRRYGENIARGAGSPAQVVRDWMGSSEHRRNILDCRLREMGIGLAVSQRRGAYWVQDFATT